MKRMGRRSGPTVDATRLQPVRAACHLGGQDDPSPVLQGGTGPTSDHRLGARPGRETPRSDVLLHQARLDSRGKSSRPTPVAGRSNAPLKIASNSWAWRTRPIVFPRPSSGPRRWRCSSTAWWSFGFTRRDINSLRFPFRPWYRKKEEPSFADMLTTLRRVSYEEKTERLLPKQSGTENLDRPAHRASQPNRVSGTSAADSRPPAPLHDRFAGGNFTRRAARDTALESAKLELSESIEPAAIA